jgi:NitT/TauT family transport system ATP-binding protein
VISFSNINHHYSNTSGKVLALSGINIDINPGEITSIIGPSGCGKTSLLNMAAGFIKPSSGKVYFNNKEINSPAPERAVVFQKDNLFSWLSVKENISLALENTNLPIKEREEIIAESLRTVGLLGFDNTLPHELSGGMQQKTAIARAIAMGSDVLLMDEPFSSLDEQSRLRLNHELISIWNKDKKTILFITHSIQEAVLLGNKVILLSKSPGTVSGVWDIDKKIPADNDRVNIRLKNQKTYKIINSIREKMDLCCKPEEYYAK